MPSVSVLSRGLIFGPFTPALAWMLPFIWMGNLVMCWIFKKMKEGKDGKEDIGGILIAAIVKAGLLFLAALVLFNFNVVPKIFLTSFGLMQFVTALLGGGGWILFNNVKCKSQNGK